jgi:L-ascorbate metabolism protein UlaG (beta-lactamase superfamily)
MTEINTITYAGHSAFFISGDDYTVGIDPWVSNPLCPTELKKPERLDLIVLTHGHSDHAGDVVRLATEYKSRVVATFELAMLLIEEGVPESQVSGMNKGGSLSVDGVSVRLTHAFHSNSFESKSGPKYAGEACGVIIEGGDKVIYHAGDTALFGDMRTIGEMYTPTIAILPIGDCFTMGPREAAYAAELVNATVTIPCHFGTFPQLTGTPDLFQLECERRKKTCRVLKPGEALSL